MNDEGDQPVMFPDEGNLLFPQFDRVVIENLKERVVLRARHRKLNDLSNEIRHDGAATASLRVEMGHVGNRHIIGELESVIPVRVAVEDAGSKALGAILPGIVVDALRSAQKLRMLSVQTAVVLQIVNVHFEAPAR